MSGFGPRGVTQHDGVDIACEPGVPVRAARTGRVLYSDTLRGYGKLNGREKRLYLETAERVLPRVKRYVLDPGGDGALPIRIIE